MRERLAEIIIDKGDKFLMHFSLGTTITMDESYSIRPVLMNQY
jgi:hypothetical protein